MSRQFGRYVEVEIRDYNSNTKTTIGNEFEIEFDYFKTLDQTNDDDSGRIRIFGLTPETIKSLQFEGGEVILRCGYTGNSIETLFIAYIARLYFDKTDNTTVTTIECSANLMNYYHMGGMSVGGKTLKPIQSFIEDFSESIGVERIEFPLKNVPEKDRGAFQEFIQTRAINAAYTGSIKDVLQVICDSFGLAWKSGDTDEGKVIVFEFTDIGIKVINKAIAQGYTKISLSNESAQTSKTFYETLKASDLSRDLTILDAETGLISSKTEYKIAYAYADQELGSNEEETAKSKEKRIKNSQSLNIWDAKEAERKAKAEASGKPYKARKRPDKNTALQVNRRYNRVKALLNPLVKPQSMVAIPDKTSVEGAYEGVEKTDVVETGTTTEAEVNNEFTVYRVRSATYKGNNKNSDWIMDLYCEDTDTNTDDQEEINRKLATMSPDDIEIIEEELDQPQE